MGRSESFAGYGPEQGYDFLLRGDRRPLRQPGRRGGRRRGVRLRRLQVRQRQHAGDLRRRQRHRRHRPGLPGLRRHQRDGRPHRRGRRQRPLRPAGLPAHHGRERLRPAAARPQGRPHLPVLAQQPHRRRDAAGLAGPLGRLRPAARGDHPVRRRLRGVHPRAGPGAQHLRDAGRPRRGHRVPQPVEDGGLHRHPLRLTPWSPRS